MATIPNQFILFENASYRTIIEVISRTGRRVDFDNTAALEKKGCVVSGEIVETFAPVVLENGRFNRVFVMKQADHKTQPMKRFNFVIQLAELGPLADLAVGSFIAIYNPKRFFIHGLPSFYVGPHGVIAWLSISHVPFPQTINEGFAPSSSNASEVQSLKHNMHTVKSRPLNLQPPSAIEDDSVCMPPPRSNFVVANRPKPNNVQDEGRSSCFHRSNSSHGHSCSNVHISHGCSASEHKRSSHETCCRPTSSCFWHDRPRCSHAALPCTCVRHHPCCSMDSSYQKCWKRDTVCGNGAHAFSCCNSVTEPVNSCSKIHDCSCHARRQPSEEQALVRTDVQPAPASLPSRHPETASSPTNQGRSRSIFLQKNDVRGMPSTSNSNDWFVGTWVDHSRLMTSSSGSRVQVQNDTLMDLPLPNSMDTNRASIGESPGDRNWLDDSDDRFTSVSQAAERLPTKLTLIPPKRKQSPKKPKRRRAISESSSSDNSIESDSSTLFLKPKIRRNPPRKTNSRDTPPDKRAKTTRTVAVESSSSDSDEDLALCLPVSAAKDKNADASEKTCDLPSINTRETQDVEEREMSAAEVSPSFLARITRRPGCPENVDKNSCPEASTSSEPRTLKQPEKRVKLYSKFDNSYYFEPPKLPTSAARPSEKPTEEDREDPAQESDSADEEAPIVSQVPEKEAVKYPVVSLIDILAGSPRREKEVTCEDLQADPATNKTGEDSETASKHESAEGRRWGKKYSQKKKGVPTRKTSRIGSSMPDLEAGESSSDNNTTGVPNPPATAPAVSDDLGDRISDGDNLNQGNDDSSLEPIPARHRISQDSDVEVILSSLGLEQSKHKDQSKTDFPEVSIQEVAKVLNDCYSPKEKTAMDVYRDLLSDREAKESSQDANLALPLASVGLETDDAVPDNAVPDNAVPDNAVPASAVPDNAVPDSAAPVNAAPDNPVPANAEPAIAVTDETTADIVVPDCPPETDLATTVDLQVAPALLEVTHVADGDAPLRIVSVQSQPSDSVDVDIFVEEVFDDPLSVTLGNSSVRMPDSTTPEFLSQDAPQSPKSNNKSPASTVFYDAEEAEAYTGSEELKRGQLYRIECSIVNLEPDISEVDDIVKGICRTGCNQVYDSSIFRACPILMKNPCALCTNQIHHLCPFCCGDSAKVPLCTQFAFVANVRTRRPPGHLLPIIVAHEEAEHFLGVKLNDYLADRELAGCVIRRLKSLVAEDSQDCIFTLIAKARPYNGQLVLKLVNPNLSALLNEILINRQTSVAE